VIGPAGQFIPGFEEQLVGHGRRSSPLKADGDAGRPLLSALAPSGLGGNNKGGFCSAIALDGFADLGVGSHRPTGFSTEKRT